MNKARHQLLAGARGAGNQNVGLGPRHLPGETEDARGGRVFEDKGVAVLGDGFENRRDKLSVRRQRNELASARLDCADRGVGVGIDAAGDDRHDDVLAIKACDKPRDIELDVDHEQIGASAGAQARERRLDVVHMADLGAARHGNPACRAEFAAQRAHNE